MKLFHLFKYYWPDNGGGIAAAMDMVIHAFKEYSKGRDNLSQEIICCWQESGKKAKKGKYNGVPVYRCKSLFEFASTQFSPQFVRTVDRRTHNDDIVIYNFPYPLVDISVLFGKIHGKLVIWWHCDFDTQKGKFITALYKPLVRHTLKKADAVIVSAEGNIDGSETLKPFRNKCHVIPFAVSDDMIEQGRRYYEKKRGLESDDGRDNKVHILFIGRFVWYKGINILLNAYSKLDNSRYELTLVGTGPLFEDMTRLSEDLQLNNITFAGSVAEEEKIDWIKWCDFLVLPSISKAEAFAIVQIEAMAFGKPVVNTWLPSGVPNVSVDGETGITVKPGDKCELLNAIKKIGHDKELYKSFSCNAINKVEKEYSMRVLEGQYKTFFEELS